MSGTPVFLYLTSTNMDNEKKTYKFGSTELDQENFLKNLDHNLRSYVEHKGWSADMSQEFYDAYKLYKQALSEGRLSSDIDGTILDSSNILDNGQANWRDKQGNTITQDQYDSMKRRKKRKVTNDFYANREVATYIDAIAKAMAAKVSGTTATAQDKAATEFDFSKHGLWNKFVSYLSPTGSLDIESWLELDQPDATTGVRATTNRAEKLSEYISEYLKDPELANYDYSKTRYKDWNTYEAAVKKLQQELGKNGVTADDYMLLNQLGADHNQYRTFFTTEKLIATPDGNTVGSDHVEEEPADAQYRTAYDTAGYKRHQIKSGANRPRGLYHPNSNNPVTATEFYEYFADKDRGNGLFDYANLQSIDNLSPIFNYLGQYYNLYRNTPGSWVDVTNGKYAGWGFLPQSLNARTRSVIAFNPKDYQAQRLYIGDLGYDAQRDYNDILRSMGIRFEAVQQKEGGTIPKHQTGAMIDPLYQAYYERSQQEAAKAVPASDATKVAIDKNPTDDNKVESPKFEWTIPEQIRLGALVADLVNVAWPGVGLSAALGYGSDAVNFGVDLYEGKGWSAVPSFAGNVALSTVALAPGVGDLLGNGTKITKALIQHAGKLNAAFASAGLIGQYPEITSSLDKIVKGKGSELTLDEVRSLALATQAVLGSAKAYRMLRARKRADAFPLDPNRVAVNVMNEGKPTKVSFTHPDDVKAIRSHTDPEELTKWINSHPDVVKSEHLNNVKVSGKFDISKTDGKYTGAPAISNNTIISPIDQSMVEQYIGSGRKWTLTENFIQNMNKKGIKETTTFDEFTFSNPHTNAKTAETKATTTEPKPAADSKSSSSTTDKPKDKSWYQKARTKVGKYINKYFFVDEKEQGGKLEYQVPAGKLGWRSMRNYNRPAKIASTVASTVETPAATPIPGIDTTPFGAVNNNNVSVVPLIKRNYGTNYTGHDPGWYAHGEYGTSSPVDITGIEVARSKEEAREGLTDEHADPNVDYRDAQASTDAKRKAWQTRNNGDNRYADYAAAVRRFLSQEQNKDKSVLDFLGEYNTDIDFMYDYKHKVAQNNQGKNAYFESDDTERFNTTHVKVYPSINSAKSEIGLNKKYIRWNGTSTAIRPTDITESDVVMDKNRFAPFITEEEKNDPVFMSFFTNIVKDTTGRYYQQEGAQNPKTPETPEVDEVTRAIDETGSRSAPEGNGAKGNSRTNPEGDSKGANPNKKSTWDSVRGYLVESLPDTLRIGRYLASRAYNKRQFELAKKTPVMLYDPIEGQRWMYGNQAAVQEAYRAAGRLNNMASTPFTSDAAKQQAAQMEAYMKGQEYIYQGNRVDDETARTTAEQVWQQNWANQQSRHSTAMKNRENLFQKRLSDIAAEDHYNASNWASLNGLLKEYQAKYQNWLDETKTARETLARESMYNEIMGNLGLNGISTDDADQQLVNDIMSGVKNAENLTADEQTRWNSIYAKAQQVLTEKFARSKGISYKPYTPGSSRSPWSADILYFNRQGGVLGEDSEKITIQKLRGRLQKMRVFQRNIEKQIDNLQKSLDRNSRNASNYIKGQKRK